VYEDARAATTNLYVKGASAASDEGTKLAGEVVEFYGLFKPGDIVGYVKAVSAVTPTILQEEDWR